MKFNAIAIISAVALQHTAFSAAARINSSFTVYGPRPIDAKSLEQELESEPFRRMLHELFGIKADAYDVSVKREGSERLGWDFNIVVNFQEDADGATSLGRACSQYGQSRAEGHSQCFSLAQVFSIKDKTKIGAVAGLLEEYPAFVNMPIVRWICQDGEAVYLTIDGRFVWILKPDRLVDGSAAVTFLRRDAQEIDLLSYSRFREAEEVAMRRQGAGGSKAPHINLLKKKLLAERGIVWLTPEDIGGPPIVLRL